jgi:Holliday junction resolvase RusA-like endonuclease
MIPVSNIIVEKLVTFTVPYLTPPSVNHYKTPTMYTGRDGYAHRGFKLTKEAKAYKEAVALFSRGRTVAPIEDKDRRRARYRVEVHVYLGPRQRLDADNGGKLLCDALEYAGVIHSDNFVAPFTCHPHKDQRDNPRTEFIVERMEP